ncbi:LysR family transcriptional regulator [Anaerosporobacter faecicola]|uniref:LysR family transcriptional regulator n=1 Tax=Anaerosporobacter faecicola TaxID=2718714 RepID=UPI00143C1133|nr:LysR family transcriptional regulator [Anaerosporobacter faecicola]
MISYDYYRVFYYVCKYENFTKAAHVLMTSQSSISHTIQNLEHQLGCRLFVRGNRGISLTPEGEQLYAYVSVGCEHLLKGETALLQSVSLEGGIIYLGTTETALHCYLFVALEAFRQRYPKVKLQIHNYTTKDAIQALKNGVVDLVVAPTPFDLYQSMKTQALCSFQDILIVGSSYSHLKDQTLSLKDLESYPLISFPQGTKSRDFMEDIYQKHNLFFSPMIESATSDLILPMVKHNLGIGFLPEAIAKDAITKGEVYQISVSEEIPSRNINLIYDSQLPQSFASKELIQYLLSTNTSK